jgi:hypothetical protein
LLDEVISKQRVRISSVWLENGHLKFCISIIKNTRSNGFSNYLHEEEEISSRNINN